MTQSNVNQEIQLSVKEKKKLNTDKPAQSIENKMNLHMKKCMGKNMTSDILETNKNSTTTSDVKATNDKVDSELNSRI